jgi:hypothetical protein
LRLQEPKEIHKFIADEAGIATEKHRQEQTSPKAIKKVRLGKENEDKYPHGGHRQFDAGKRSGAVRQDCVHKRVRLNHAVVNEQKRKKRIGTGQQHCSDGQKEQPRMVPVQEEGTRNSPCAT